MVARRLTVRLGCTLLHIVCCLHSFILLLLVAFLLHAQRPHLIPRSALEAMTNLMYAWYEW